MQKANLIGSGLASLAVQNVGGLVDSAVTATGSSSQTDAYALYKDYTEVTAGAGNTGVRLPANCSPGDSFWVYNITGNTILLYPPTGESINAIAANSSYSVSNAKHCLVTKLSATRWGAGTLA